VPCQISGDDGVEIEDGREETKRWLQMKRDDLERKL
jgi:hypothetical protein